MDRVINGHFGQNGLVAALGTWSDGGGPLYRRLAAALQAAVERGDLPDGARLPPERELAQRLHISRSTVVAAYACLADAQLLERRQGSGTRVHTKRAPNTAARDTGTDLTRELGRNALFRGLLDRPSAALDLAGAYLLAPGGLPSMVF